MTNKIFSIKEEETNNKRYKVVKFAGVKFKFKKSEIKFNTVHYMVAMLKAYGIKYIVTSPGRQNSLFNSIVQNDRFFKCYSVVDERSAAYVATGIAYETNEPVVITCTGATASRNYLSALTEAYYRKLPIIALTFFAYDSNIFNLSPQFVDRSCSQKDIKTLSVELPRMNDKNDKNRFMIFANAALVNAKYKQEPVHINCPAYFNYDLNSQSLPEDIWTTKYYDIDFEYLISDLKNKNIGIYIGAHHKFDNDTMQQLSDFAESYDAAVFCDHTSNYHGKNKILISVASTSQIRKHAADIIIDIGSISGDYNSFRIFNGAEIWRVSEDGLFRCRQSFPLAKLFACKEKEFFRYLKNNSSDKIKYYDLLKTINDNYQIPSLELSNLFVCNELARRLPKNSSLHLAILNSLRSMDFINLDESIDVNSNVGGFGIDGPLSTLLGQSFVNKDKLYFGVTGDLAFFYDMNALGQRDFGNNIRLIVINNNKGVEFKLNAEMEKMLGDAVDPLIAAAGHYKGGLKGWVESCGLRYMCAQSKEEFYAQIDEFCSEKADKSIVFEIITNDKDEKSSLKKVLAHNK